MLGPLPLPQLCIQHAGISPQRQRILITVNAACERHEASLWFRHRAWLRSPARRTACHRWLYPDLKNPRRYLFEIVFGMPDAGAGAYDLDCSGFDPAFVAKAIA